MVLGGEVGPDALGALLAMPLGPIFASCGPAQWQSAPFSTGPGASAATGAADNGLQSLHFNGSACAAKASEVYRIFCSVYNTELVLYTECVFTA